MRFQVKKHGQDGFKFDRDYGVIDTGAHNKAVMQTNNKARAEEFAKELNEVEK